LERVVAVNTGLAYINGKNWPVYNQVQGQQSHSSKTAKANITLDFGFGRTPFRSLSMPLPAKSCGKLVDVKFALIYDSSHDFAGKGVLNDLNGILPK